MSTPILTALRFYFAGTGVGGFLLRFAQSWMFVSAALVILAEAIMLASFTAFLRRTTVSVDPASIDKKFVIIAHYGIACVALAFMALGFFTVYATGGDYLWYTAVTVGFWGISLCMLAMKVVLYREDVAKRKLTTPRVARFTVSAMTTGAS
ncbi:hypothetical protein HDU83_008000 [Entophlyctis luteolus]|nr:hypothetical protein HDU83_008000 [Entophlyctis luteolus]KAJ3389615.1 hypothetical protein HDU84_008536 [Entophlyctis sp. JEL0112]